MNIITIIYITFIIIHYNFSRQPKYLKKTLDMTDILYFSYQLIVYKSNIN